VLPWYLGDGAAQYCGGQVLVAGGLSTGFSDL
jgi:hypothetical protein